MMLYISFIVWPQAPVLFLHTLLAHTTLQNLELSNFKAGPGPWLIQPLQHRPEVPSDWKHRPPAAKHISGRAGLEESKFLVTRKTAFPQRWFGGHQMSRLSPKVWTDKVSGLTSASLCFENTKGKLRKICTHQQGWILLLLVNAALPPMQGRTLVLPSCLSFPRYRLHQLILDCGLFLFIPVPEERQEKQVQIEWLGEGSQEVCALTSAGQGTGICGPVELWGWPERVLRKPTLIQPLSDISDSPQGKGDTVTLSQPWQYRLGTGELTTRWGSRQPHAKWEILRAGIQPCSSHSFKVGRQGGKPYFPASTQMLEGFR